MAPYHSMSNSDVHSWEQLLSFLNDKYQNIRIIERERERESLWILDLLHFIYILDIKMSNNNICLISD